MTRPRAVITNDDGIRAEGIRQLAMAAIDCGFDVTVAAPMEESSGASASLTAINEDGRVVVEPRRLEGVAAPAYGVKAMPGFIALLAVRGAFGPPPDVILSGINMGPNMGHAVLHSGTVGAALTAATHGCRGMAFSLETSPPRDWEASAQVARVLIPKVMELDGPLVINVNVPDVPVGELKGIRRAGLAAFGAVQTNVLEVGEGFVQVAFGDVGAKLEDGTDACFVSQGFVTVTPLVPICEHPALDVRGFNDSDLEGLL